MKLAFYAPLKPPDHPVPSGDRQMARLLIEALKLAGHEVEIASRLRSYVPEPDFNALELMAEKAATEAVRIAAEWEASSPPDAWFAYHPYYKAPDLIGPGLARRFNLPYVTAEASHSSRRNAGAWAVTQKQVVDAVTMAAVNFCFTARDRSGLAAAAPGASFTMLPPFIDIAPYTEDAADNPGRLVSVAMMRSGDKFESFRMLAGALMQLADVPWTLSVIGDGPRRDDVMQLFAALPRHRLKWLGQAAPESVPRLLRQGGIYVWPGVGEAYGLAYLEAQAAGLAVVAQDIAGVPEVVRNGETGILTLPGDIAVYAAAIRRLLTDGEERRRMARAARRFVLEERSLKKAARIIGGALETLHVR